MFLDARVDCLESPGTVFNRRIALADLGGGGGDQPISQNVELITLKDIVPEPIVDQVPDLRGYRPGEKVEIRRRGLGFVS